MGDRVNLYTWRFLHSFFLRLNRGFALLNDTGAPPITDAVTALYRYHRAAKAFGDHPEPGEEETDIRPGS